MPARPSGRAGGERHGGALALDPPQPGVPEELGAGAAHGLDRSPGRDEADPGGGCAAASPHAEARLLAVPGRGDAGNTRRVDAGDGRAPQLGDRQTLTARGLQPTGRGRQVDPCRRDQGDRVQRVEGEAPAG
jgi:hypothetical protein